MDLEFFILGGYGQFVWPAFIFTFLSCFILYLKTKKELKKQEKIFLNDYKELYNAEIKNSARKKYFKESFSANSI